MISTWGNQTTAYQYTGTQVWGQPTGTPQMTCRGAGGIAPEPNARNANTVPAFRRSLTRAQSAPCHVAATLPTFDKQRGRNRMGGPWDCSPRQIGMTWAARAGPTGPSGSVLFFGCRPRPFPRLHPNQYISTPARARPDLRTTQASRAAAPRGPGRGKWWRCGTGASKNEAVRAIGAAVGPDRSGRGAGCLVAGRDAARVRKS